MPFCLNSQEEQYEYQKAGVRGVACRLIWSMKVLHPMRRASKKNQHARPSGLSRDVAGIE